MERDELTNKARANKCISDAMNFTDSRRARQSEMAAFLDFMHPELSADQKAEMIRQVE